MNVNLIIKDVQIGSNQIGEIKYETSFEASEYTKIMQDIMPVVTEYIESLSKLNLL
jgi:hypothetical protein